MPRTGAVMRTTAALRTSALVGPTLPHQAAQAFPGSLSAGRAAW